MKVTKITLDAGQLATVPDAELSFFFTCGYVLNEIMALHKFHLWSSHFDTDEIEKRGRLFHTLLVSKILAGKLYEANELFTKKYYGTSLSKNYGTLLTDDENKTLKEIRKYFDKSNPIKNVRNNYSFHYSQIWDLDVRSLLQNMSDSQDLTIYLSETNGNSLFYLSDVVVNSSMLSTIDEHEQKGMQAAMDSFIGDTVKLSTWFISFLNGFMIAVMKKYWPDLSSVNAPEIEITGLPNLRDIRIGYFFELGESSKAAKGI